jgi:hypothetical protein
MPQRKPTPKLPLPLSESYPHLCRWVAELGTLEIGYSHETRSFIRTLDTGGMVWHGRRSYRTLDAALSDAEASMARFMKLELGIEDDV